MIFVKILVLNFETFVTSVATFQYMKQCYCQLIHLYQNLLKTSTIYQALTLTGSVIKLLIY